MPHRAVVLGEAPPELVDLLDRCAPPLDVVLDPPAPDREAVRRALAERPPIAVVMAALADGPALPLLRALPAEARPAAVIICSPREGDAVRAFEVHATDFLLLPTSAPRVAEALARARQQLLQGELLRAADELQRLLGEGGTPPAWRADDGGRRRRRGGGAGAGTLVATMPRRVASAPLDEGVLDLAAEGQAVAGAGHPLRVLVRDGRRTRFVPLAEVDWFEADGNYLVIHVGGGTFRTRGTIVAVEQALDPRQFVRIHRRRVVNMDRVRELVPLPGGDGLLTLGDGTTLRLSRTFRARVR
jgi:two-component system LytT family response regulator